MGEFWQRFFDFVEKHLPGLLLAFGLGHRLAEKKVEALKKENMDLKLEKELAENRSKVVEDNKHKSNSDIIGDAIREGRHLK